MSKGFNFTLPQLPKVDYLLLKKLCLTHQATQVEILMAALRTFAHLRPSERRDAIAGWRKPESVHQETEMHEDDPLTSP